MSLARQNIGLHALQNSPDQSRYLTWTICRGCTESVGKFPRPWIGTLSPRIESNLCTCSQDNTQNRRLCSDTSPEDMMGRGKVVKSSVVLVDVGYYGQYQSNSKNRCFFWSWNETWNRQEIKQNRCCCASQIHLEQKFLNNLGWRSERVLHMQIIDP